MEQSLALLPHTSRSIHPSLVTVASSCTSDAATKFAHAGPELARKLSAKLRCVERSSTVKWFQFCCSNRLRYAQGNARRVSRSHTRNLTAPCAWRQERPRVNASLALRDELARHWRVAINLHLIRSVRRVIRAFEPCTART